MNSAAILIILIGLALFIMGARNTYRGVLGSLFQTPATTQQSSTPPSGTVTGQGGSTRTYKASDLQSLAQQAGFSRAQSVIASAIALAESGGQTNTTGPFGERGLWQVYPAAHPDLASQFDLYDPLQNAKAAFAVFQMQGWSAWTTYTSGAYKQYL